jgi:hypothetical protein
VVTKLQKIEKFLYIIFAVLGFIFLRSGYYKVTEGKFVNGLASTLEKFAAKNPYPWYKDFLNDIAIPNSQIFGILTMWGEVLTGLALILISAFIFITGKSSKLLFLILALGFLGGMALNGAFYLASAWTSPSTEGLNLVMFLIELTGLVFVLSTKLRQREH